MRLRRQLSCTCWITIFFAIEAILGTAWDARTDPKNRARHITASAADLLAGGSFVWAAYYFWRA